MAEAPQVSDKDTSVEAMSARLVVLQSSLGGVLLKSNRLLDEFHAVAPTPREAPEDFPVTAVTPANAPQSPSMDVRLPDGRLLSVDRNGHPNQFPSFPLRKAALWAPLGNRYKKITAEDHSHSPRRAGVPYDIETSLWDSVWGRHLEFVDYGYVGQARSVVEINTALDDARSVAREALAGYVKKRGHSG